MMESSNSTAKMLDALNKSKSKDIDNRLQPSNYVDSDMEIDENDLFPSLGSVLQQCLNPNNSKDNTPQS
jgi:hypothetical protein